MHSEWKPWEDYKQEAEVLPILAPPCHYCKHWKPVRLYSGPHYTGVRLCHALEQTRDFSCFSPKPEA